MQIPPGNNVITNYIPYYKPDAITTIYGNAATGKTTLCMQTCLEVIKKQKKVIYIDSEKGFHAQRFMQLGGNKEDLENIMFLFPTDFNNQTILINQAKQVSTLSQVALVIVDTIGHFYRNELPDNKPLVTAQLLEQMRSLFHIARDNKCTVLMTSQVYASTDNTHKVIGGSIVEKLSHTLFELRKEQETRHITLQKYKYDIKASHYLLGQSIEYKIKEKGLFSCEVIN